MPVFSIDGSTDPFMRVELAQGEAIFAERDAMASMSASLKLTGKAKGGVLKSLARAVTTGESFFMQEISAPDGPGNIMLSPRQPGEVHKIDLDNEEWMLSDGVFLAAEESIAIKTVRQKSLGAAVFGGTGGFFQLQASGSGTLVVSCIGALRKMDVAAGEEIIVDSGHAVAWPKSLSMKASLSTGQGGGIIGKMVGSAKTGEGVVLRFNGGADGGTVLIASRSRPSFIGWISEQMPAKG
jgi:uncharacterized protein (TIGR00266 family)